MKKQPSVWCDRGMFQGPSYALVTTPKLFKRELKRMGIKDDLPYVGSKNFNATCYAFENNGRECFIVTLKDWEKADYLEVIGILAHEATHIKQHIMRIIGEKNPSDEFEAYMMQNIVANLVECFASQTKRSLK